MANKRRKRIVVEKYFYDLGFNNNSTEAGQKVLLYQYPKLNPKIIDAELQDILCIGCRGQIAIEILEGDGARSSMNMKVVELKGDKMLTNEGIYQEPLSWNEFRSWVLANPEVMDEWFDYHYGTHARYQTKDDTDNDNDICWEGIVE